MATYGIIFQQHAIHANIRLFRTRGIKMATELFFDNMQWKITSFDDRLRQNCSVFVKIALPYQVSYLRQNRPVAVDSFPSPSKSPIPVNN